MPVVCTNMVHSALAGAAMISNAPGTVNDIVTEEYRALAFSIWSIGPMVSSCFLSFLHGFPRGRAAKKLLASFAEMIPNVSPRHILSFPSGLRSCSFSSQDICKKPMLTSLQNGPVTGPLIGGFAAEYLGWRWTNWIVMILSGVAWIACSFVAETYAPAILRKKAAKMRKETGDDRWFCRYDQRISSKSLSLFILSNKANTIIVVQSLKINLSRPFVLSFTEPILWFWNAYIAVCILILFPSNVHN